MPLTRRAVFLLFLAAASANAQWTQLGRDPQHSGAVPNAAQPMSAILADFVYDPFVAAELLRGGGSLLVHFQAAIVDDDDVFIVVKSGSYSLQTWSTQTWNIANLRWSGKQLEQRWITASDWKPAPNAEAGAGPGFEPLFHAVLANGAIYMPAAGGSILQIDRGTGAVIKRINPFPFGSGLDATIVTGPLAADGDGNIIYSAMKFDPSHPWLDDIAGAWLVRVTPAGTSTIASYTSLTPGAPPANSQCLGQFTSAQLPWPPSPEAIPPASTCGSQRPGLNVTPAIASDGTIVTVSRAHLNSRYSYLVAVNPDLTIKWTASLRDRLNDGCNVLLPANGLPGGCRQGAHTGRDPGDNTTGAGRVTDDSTSSPVIAPDGSVFYGAYTRYNYSQGHLMHFSATGAYLGAYRFGWDITPSIWSHDLTYSVILKENHYAVGSYCSGGDCPPGRTLADPESYAMTRLSPALDIEWQYFNHTTSECERIGSEIVCSGDGAFPNGFEWCVNAPAVDARGVAYMNSEDGFVYAIDANGHIVERLFLQLALGAAYTPISIDARGRVYAQNAGHLFVVGAQARRRIVSR